MLMDDCKRIATEIFNDLGSGFEEPIYQKAFEVALRLEHIPYENTTIVPVSYKGFCIGEQKLDLMVHNSDGNIIIELKAILALSQKDSVQLQKYMELLNISSGILINFPQSSTAKTIKEIKTEPEIVVIGVDNLVMS